MGQLDAGVLQVDLPKPVDGMAAQVVRAQLAAAEGQAPPGADSPDTTAADVAKPADKGTAPAGDTAAAEATAAADRPKPVAGESAADYQRRLDEYDKRLKDTQRALHGKTEEVRAAEATAAAATQRADGLEQQVVVLKGQLDTVLANPELRLVVAQPAAAATTEEQAYKDAYQVYKAAPDDEAAVVGLLKAAEELSFKRIRREQAQEVVQQENVRRTHETMSSVTKEISAWVQKVDPAVPLTIFWGFTRTAEAMTPPELKTAPVSQRIAWQAQKALELARETLRERDQKVLEAARTGQGIEHTAGIVMAAGGARPPAPAAAGGRLNNGIPTAGTGDGLSMVDQLAALHTKRFGGASP